MKHFFWDSCVIVAYRNQETTGCDLPSLNRFVLDAKSGICKLYASTITIAEILPSYLQDRKFTSYQKFVADMESGFIQISPNQNILTLSARLRDLKYSKVAGRHEISERKLDVPDAIMLATGIMLKTAYHVDIDEFHTYDKGGKRSVEGTKCVPLLEMESWCEKMTLKQKTVVQAALDLKRCHPVHPNPDLPGV